MCFNHLITESPSNIGNGLDPTSGASGWELALVTAPSSNGSAVTESKLVKALLFPHGYCRNFPTVMLIAFVCCKNGIFLVELRQWKNLGKKLAFQTNCIITHPN